MEEKTNRSKVISLKELHKELEGGSGRGSVLNDLLSEVYSCRTLFQESQYPCIEAVDFVRPFPVELNKKGRDFFVERRLFTTATVSPMNPLSVYVRVNFDLKGNGVVDETVSDVSELMLDKEFLMLAGAMAGVSAGVKNLAMVFNERGIDEFIGRKIEALPSNLKKTLIDAGKVKTVDVKVSVDELFHATVKLRDFFEKIVTAVPLHFTDAESSRGRTLHDPPASSHTPETESVGAGAGGPTSEHVFVENIINLEEKVESVSLFSVLGFANGFHIEHFSKRLAKASDEMAKLVKLFVEEFGHDDRNALPNHVRRKFLVPLMGMFFMSVRFGFIARRILPVVESFYGTVLDFFDKAVADRGKIDELLKTFAMVTWSVPQESVEGLFEKLKEDREFGFVRDTESAVMKDMIKKLRDLTETFDEALAVFLVRENFANIDNASVVIRNLVASIEEMEFEFPDLFDERMKRKLARRLDVVADFSNFSRLVEEEFHLVRERFFESARAIGKFMLGVEEVKKCIELRACAKDASSSVHYIMRESLSGPKWVWYVSALGPSLFRLFVTSAGQKIEEYHADELFGPERVFDFILPVEEFRERHIFLSFFKTVMRARVLVGMFEKIARDNGVSFSAELAERIETLAREIDGALDLFLKTQSRRVIGLKVKHKGLFFDTGKGGRNVARKVKGGGFDEMVSRFEAVKAVFADQLRLIFVSGLRDASKSLLVFDDVLTKKPELEVMLENSFAERFAKKTERKTAERKTGEKPSTDEASGRRGVGLVSRGSCLLREVFESGSYNVWKFFDHSHDVYLLRQSPVFRGMFPAFEFRPYKPDRGRSLMDANSATGNNPLKGALWLLTDHIFKRGWTIRRFRNPYFSVVPKGDIESALRVVRACGGSVEPCLAIFDSISTDVVIGEEVHKSIAMLPLLERAGEPGLRVEREVSEDSEEALRVNPR